MARKPALGLPAPVAPVIRETRPPSRTGKKAIAFWVDNVIFQEFRVGLTRANTNAQTLCVELITQWMRDQGMKLPES